MAELVYTEGFVEDAASVREASKREELRRVIDLLADFPDIGSPFMPESLRRKYGDSARKLVVNPFDVVYEYDAVADAVYLLGLVHQRAAW